MTLNESNYFSREANMEYMSASQFKSFQKCEACALAELRGEYIREETTALLVGSYVDAYFSGTLDLFRAQHSEIYKRDGSLKSEYEQASYIIQRIERDEQFMAAISGPTQVIMTGEIEGVPVKIKIDCPQPYITVDMKIMRDMADVYNKDERSWEPFWKSWGYNIQGAIYREIRRQNEGILLPFGLAVATKEKPEPDIDLLTLPATMLDSALEIVRADIVYFDGLKKGLYEPVRCEKCAWCRQTKILTGWSEATA